jgi:hypothetical protein
MILVYKFKSFVDIQKGTIFFIQHARNYALFDLACKVCSKEQANVQAASWHGTNMHVYFCPISLQDTYSLDICLQSIQ